MKPPSLSKFLKSPSVEQPFAVVIGYPIGHSLSPCIHNAALKHQGIDVTYYAVEVSPDAREQLPALLHHPNFRGANVTIPWKQDVLNLLDDYSQTVRHTNACNTIIPYQHGQLRGENTDIAGFIAPLNAYTEFLKGRRAVIFGSGGASSAVVYGLKMLGMTNIVVVSRSPETQGKLEKGVRLAGYDDWMIDGTPTALYVNTTPLGMYPDTGQSPVDDRYISMLSGTICYDIVYRPVRTRFLVQAELAGAQCIYGTEMFLGQASKAFELFFQTEFPMTVASRALYTSLES